MLLMIRIADCLVFSLSEVKFMSTAHELLFGHTINRNNLALKLTPHKQIQLQPSIFILYRESPFVLTTFEHLMSPK